MLSINHRFVSKQPTLNMAKRSIEFTSTQQTTPKTFLQQAQTAPLSPGDINSSNPNATVQALVTSISPIKPSKIFDGQFTDGDSIIRLVGFDKKQREKLHSFCDKNIPITVKDCQVQQNKVSAKFEVVVKSYTQV